MWLTFQGETVHHGGAGMAEGVRGCYSQMSIVRNQSINASTQLEFAFYLVQNLSLWNYSMSFYLSLPNLGKSLQACPITNLL